MGWRCSTTLACSESVVSVLWIDTNTTTVSAVTENTSRQTELKVSQQIIEKLLQDTEEDVKALPQELSEVIKYCTDEAVQDSEEIFTQLIHLIEKWCSDVKQQENKVNWVKELKEERQQEISMHKLTEMLS